MADLPKRLKIGIPLIDEEHKALLNELNGLFIRPEDTPQSAEFTEALSRLTSKLLDHFASEERVMVSLGIPGDELARETLNKPPQKAATN